MISGLNSFGIASAIRTAGQARATMDKAARELATGQRVASVKDDGAAWARANRLRGDASARETLAGILDYQKAGVSWARETGEIRMTFLDEAGELALAAMTPGLSASATSSLEQTYLQARASYNRNTYTVMNSDLTLGRADGLGDWVPFTTLAPPVASNLSWIEDINGATASWGLTAAISIGMNSAPTDSIATTALATTALGVIRTVSQEKRNAIAQLGALETRLERSSERQQRRADLERGLASSLTDADLGRASAARAQAETRQQLALSTVRQAISAYGNFAGGLLGNVQRTQRGILA